MLDLTNEIGYGTRLGLTGGGVVKPLSKNLINDSFLETFIFNESIVPIHKLHCMILPQKSTVDIRLVSF